MTPCHGMLYSSRSISTLNRAPVHTAAEGQPDGYATLIGQIGTTMEMGRPGGMLALLGAVLKIRAATRNASVVTFSRRPGLLLTTAPPHLDRSTLRRRQNRPARRGPQESQ